jgi:hypothetical protein
MDRREVYIMVIEFPGPYKESTAANGAEKIAMDMPEEMAQRFLTHLERKRLADSSRGRYTRTLEIEASL